jgi:uncharacterized protein YndB with AHSA1/START domain
MLVRTLLVLALLITAVLIFAATRPATFRVQRSITINAAPEKIFPLLNDFHNWPAWAPQDKEDPAMLRTYSGAPSGLGAVSDWSGKGNTGKGRMEIAQSVPFTQIIINVDWVRPFHTRNINEFTLQPAGSATTVTWTMHGPNLFPMKLMSLFVNMDRLMGKHFESGLANLNAAAEK